MAKATVCKTVIPQFESGCRLQLFIRVYNQLDDVAVVDLVVSENSIALERNDLPLV